MCKTKTAAASYAILPAILFLACCLPPFDGLYDRWYSHKWYAAGFMGILLSLWAAWRLWKGGG